MTDYDAGDWRIATLAVTPFDGSTTVVLQVESPAGTLTTPAVTKVDDDGTTAMYESVSYELSEGEWIERWSVTGTGKSKQRTVLQVAPDPASGPSGALTYATTADYARWLGTAPPSGARRALAQATRDITQMLTTAIYDVDDDSMPTDPVVLAAIRDAVCAQAEYARATGDQYSVGAARVTQASIGSISVTRSSGTAGGTGSSRFSPRAWQILRDAGLTGHAVYH